jgi:hypothetical protein
MADAPGVAERSNLSDYCMMTTDAVWRNMEGKPIVAAVDEKQIG